MHQGPAPSSVAYGPLAEATFPAGLPSCSQQGGTAAADNDISFPLLSLPDGPRLRVLSLLSACDAGGAAAEERTAAGCLNAVRLVCRALRKDADAAVGRMSRRGVWLEAAKASHINVDNVGGEMSPPAYPGYLAILHKLAALNPPVVSPLHLDLGHCGLGPEEASQLASVLPRLTRLQRLELPGNLV